MRTRRHNVNVTVDPRQLAYKKHKDRALSRGIPFEMEFWEWLQVWEESGHFHERGTRKGQWVMARFRDQGPYRVGNVRIVRAETNTAEAHALRRGG